MVLLGFRFYKMNPSWHLNDMQHKFPWQTTIQTKKTTSNRWPHVGCLELWVDLWVTWELIRKIDFLILTLFGYLDLSIPRASCSQNCRCGGWLGGEVDEGGVFDRTVWWTSGCFGRGGGDFLIYLNVGLKLSHACEARAVGGFTARPRWLFKDLKNNCWWFFHSFRIFEKSSKSQSYDVDFDRFSVL